MRYVTMLILLVLSACWSGPSVEDVEADRARWTAVRDATADGVIEPAEKAAWAQFMLDWDDKLAADEKAAGQKRDPNQILVGLVRAYGVAAVQVFLGPELQRKAPAVFAMIDQDHDGLLTEAELLSVRPDDPAFAAVVLLTVQALIRR